MKSILKSFIVGGVLGVAYKFVVNPLIKKPVEKTVDKVVKNG